MRILAVLLLLPGFAWAHALLEGAVPPVGSTVATAPTELQLRFSEGIEPRFTKISVTAASGTAVSVGTLHVDPSDNHRLLVPLPKLAAGTYMISWHAVSVDTHRSLGSYRFTVLP